MMGAVKSCWPRKTTETTVVAVFMCCCAACDRNEQLVDYDQYKNVPSRPVSIPDATPGRVAAVDGAITCRRNELVAIQGTIQIADGVPVPKHLTVKLVGVTSGGKRIVYQAAGAAVSKQVHSDGEIQYSIPLKIPNRIGHCTLELIADNKLIAQGQVVVER